MNIKDLAIKVQNRLLDEGFIVHRYDSYSTNSIYLKLDYGVANSIRISDYKGKRYLSYRYNLCDVHSFKIDNSGEFTKLLFLYDEWDEMINTIISNKTDKINKYGENLYDKFIIENKKKSKIKKGFWSGAYKVHK